LNSLRQENYSENRQACEDNGSSWSRVDNNRYKYTKYYGDKANYRREDDGLPEDFVTECLLMLAKLEALKSKEPPLLVWLLLRRRLRECLNINQKTHVLIPAARA